MDIPDINALILNLLISGDLLKAQELIDEHKITTIEFNNLSVAEDGILCYDVVMHHFVKPISKLEFININIIVTPTGIKFEDNE